MPEDDVVVLLIDMFTAAATANERVAGVTWESFESDLTLLDAVVRQIQNIGEAALELPEDFRDSHPEIPRPEIIGMRHRLVHGYRQVATRTVWDTARDSLPPLISTLESLIPPEDRMG